MGQATRTGTFDIPTQKELTWAKIIDKKVKQNEKQRARFI